MPKVYVTQENSYNFLSAEAHGEIVFLTRDDLSNVRGSLTNEHLLLSLKRQLRKFNADEDFILVAGSPYVTAAVFLILGSMGFVRVPVLRWSNRDRVYIPLELNLTAEVLAS